MSFKTDKGGIALKSDVKLMNPNSTWATRLSQLGKTTGKVIICTYSLPNIEYVKKIFDKRSDIYLITHEKFSNKARILQNFYPELRIFLRNNVHAKMCLIEPDTVWLSSENFGNSGWFEFCCGLHNKNAYDWYKNLLSRSLNIEF